MPESLLNFELAWRRVHFDLADRRAFVRHPFLDSLIATDLPVWIRDLTQSMTTARFRPDSCRIVPVPKPFGHIRPGADLCIADQVVYAALVEQIRPQIADALGPGPGSRAYSYHLRSERTHAQWFEPFFPLWQAFDRDSVLAIEEGAQFVVVADVAGFYENIDLNTLRSDLNGLGIDSTILNQLMECLHRWVRIQRRGVPQGHSPSDLLAKLYLHPVDLALVAEGFDHRRWVDDFRIFCTTEAEARRALVVLADALGRRGLVLQTKKSRILSAEEARVSFAEVPTLLNPIQADVAHQIARGEGNKASYLPPWILDRALAGAGAGGAIEVLRAAFHAYFVAPSSHFNKSLFHYLLSRLSAAHDATYATETIALLRRHPEEFDPIADYCTAVGASEALEVAFIQLRRSGLVPYPYMIYQLLRWRVREERPLSTAMRTLVRGFAFEAGHP